MTTRDLSGGGGPSGAFRGVAGDALTLDAVGTVLRTMQPVARVYAEAARRHGHDVDPADVEARLLPAMRDRSDRSAGDPAWMAYWRRVVKVAVGTDDDRVFEDLYVHFGRGVAWHVDPQARFVASRFRARGVKVAIISNFDRRLRPLAASLGITDWIDLLVVSAEEGLEKPNPAIFARTCERLGVPLERVLHVGDSHTNDVQGARAAGCGVLQMGRDLRTLSDLVDHYG